MTITHDTMTVETVLHAVRQLSPSILDRAAEIETGRRVPLDLIEDLRAAGCFRLVRPATHGGLEASITDAMRVYSDDMRHQRLSRAEEKAYALPAKLSVPMMVCIFPVLFVVILLPVFVKLHTGHY